MLERTVDKCTSLLSSWLWPVRCVLCGQSGQAGLDLCAGCEADLPRNDVACVRCAEPLASDAGQPLLCGACVRWLPPFHSAWVPFRYAFPIDRLVQGLKYRRDLPFGRVLGQLLARRLMSRVEPLPELIIPVPLALRRYRERGYNQACELALPVQRSTRVSVRSDLVFRTSDTLEQAALDRKQRRRNIRGAFSLAKPLPARHVAILDDVITTGSTAAELAKLLRRSGADRVEVWAIARADRRLG